MTKISEEGFKRGFMEKVSEPNLYRDRVEVFLRDQLGRILMGRRKDQPGRPEGIWIIPGGGVDPGESHRQAAKREALEEAGYRGIRYRQVSPEVMEFPYTHNPTYRGSRTKYYTGLAKERDMSLFGADEDQLSETKFFPIDTVIQMLQTSSNIPGWKKSNTFRARMLEKLKQQLEKQ